VKTEQSVLEKKKKKKKRKKKKKKSVYKRRIGSERTRRQRGELVCSGRGRLTARVVERSDEKMRHDRVHGAPDCRRTLFPSLNLKEKSTCTQNEVSKKFPSISKFQNSKKKKK
jgi:hypothetical protein